MHQQEPNFDDNCKLVIVNRLIEQNMDYRLNNNLQISCNEDIKKYCSDIIGKYKLIAKFHEELHLTTQILLNGKA